MKNILLTLLLLLSSAGFTFSQTEKPLNQEKPNQKDLLNDFYVSYGVGSLFYYIDQNSNYSYSSPGTFIFGYTNSLSKVIAIGFQLGYTPITTVYNSTSNEKNQIDNYVQGLARIKFQYLNKPVFCMYSGIAMGVTMDYYTDSFKSGSPTNHQKLLPAGQLTLLGFRIGRSAAFVGEFGLGTLSILNLGFSYKFGQ
jgi:hypothetical protein